MTHRIIQEIQQAQPTQDGDGVAIRRISGVRHASMDPVLLVDELRSDDRADFMGGFPPHPHRGMQTLTYMIRGGIQHRDSQGNEGEIRDGGAQWMSAGRGVIHSEMPTADTDGMHGFQLWFNLPAADKMSEPQYRDIPADELAVRVDPGYEASAIAGSWVLDGESLSGPLQSLSAEGALLDITLQPNQGITLSGLEGTNTLLYIYAGEGHSGDRQVREGQLAVTGQGDELVIISGNEGMRVLTIKGAPLSEPVASYGPFVMNTAAEIEQALADYRDGQFDTLPAA